MDRVSDDRLQELINWVGYRVGLTEWKDGVWVDAKRALTELRERRAAENAPCPEHANMVAELCPICGRGHNIGNPCYRIK